MKRLKIIDAYRGFVLVNMLAYHGFYDWVNILAKPLTWFSATWVYAWQQMIVFSFVLISGFVFNYSQHQRRRGILLCLWGCFLTVCTYFFVPQELIIFGILSFFGSAMLITSMLKSSSRHGGIISGFCVLGFLFTQGWQQGYWGFYGVHLAMLKFAPPDNLFFFILGIPGTSHYSADYAPIFPWIFVFWLGFFGWQIVRHRLESRSILVKAESKGAFGVYNSLAFLGRNTLVIYLLHQPILYFLFKSFF